MGNYERYQEPEDRPASSKSAKYLSCHDEGEGDFSSPGEVAVLQKTSRKSFIA
jgi:hypothetical protein